MCEINCMAGDPRRKVRLTVTVDMEFMVGGRDDDDRMDSVRMAFEDHYDDAVDQSFWREAITGMAIADIGVANEEGET